MPIDTELAMKQWVRYAWARDNGHSDFVDKADLCDKFFQGDQWSAMDKAKLRAQRRPALTINKIMSTISNVMGEQIYNRSEIAYRPRSGASSDIADVLTKVFKQISDNNQLDWLRSDVFADGIITSRGFFDVRLAYNDNMQGEVRLQRLNPKNVIVDPDAEEYDPDTWGEVFITKWMTADDIAVLYSDEDADLLRGRDSCMPYGFDSIEMRRDRFGGEALSLYSGTYDFSAVMRNIRVIERQHRVLQTQKHFLSAEGDTREVPDNFDRNKIAFFVEKYGFQVIKKQVRRIRWTVTADNVRLHDDFSPYKHFTVVPYFPHFRHGQTVGLVENLLGPQELLNKVSSQELHVVNTTANSGWKVKTGAMTNMTVEELEEKGAQTGLVIEVSGDADKDVQKITPNQVPQGLDRISYKAEEHLKAISGVSDSMQGQDRADVAAKAIQAKRQAGSTNLVKPLDSLVRTDFMLARNILDVVQEFYTEERLLSITHDSLTNETENFTVNQVTPEGEVINDLTLGEYGVVVSSVPQRETLEDSQFEQAMALREAGIKVPDEVLIKASRLMDKSDIIKRMQAEAETPEAKRARELQERLQSAEVDKTEGEARAKHADAGLRDAKTQKEMVQAQKLAEEEPEGPDQGALLKAQADIALDREKFQHEVQLDREKFAHEREMDNLKRQDDARAQAQKAATDRVVALQQAAKPAEPTTQP